MILALKKKRVRQEPRCASAHELPRRLRILRLSPLMAIGVGIGYDSTASRMTRRLILGGWRFLTRWA